MKKQRKGRREASGSDVKLWILRRSGRNKGHDRREQEMEYEMVTVENAVKGRGKPCRAEKKMGLTRNWLQHEDSVRATEENKLRPKRKDTSGYVM